MVRILNYIYIYHIDLYIMLLVDIFYVDWPFYLYNLYNISSSIAYFIGANVGFFSL